MSGWLRPSAAGTAVALAAVLLTPAPVQADATRDAQWHLKFLKVAEAHQITKGKGVRIGIADTGVDRKHPDLAGALAPGVNFTGFGNPDEDFGGHGTAMAGLAGARGRANNVGSLGIAPEATLVPIKIFGADYATEKNMIAGIDWAAKNDIDVLNVATGDDGMARALKPAVDAALAADIVIVAASGNAVNGPEIVDPAAMPGVLAVSAVDQNGNFAAVSVQGPQIAIAAPGARITAPRLSGGYSLSDGTSDAAAIVSGVAALVRAKYPDLSAAEVIHRITSTAVDKGPPGRDPQYGFGIIDPVRALTADVPPLAQSAAPSRAGGTPPVAQRDEPVSGSRNRTIMVLSLAVGAMCIVGLLGVGGIVFALRRRS